MPQLDALLSPLGGLTLSDKGMEGRNEVGEENGGAEEGGEIVVGM